LEARTLQFPNDPSAWRLLGKVRLQGGDFLGAQQALSRALELDPANPAAHFDLGQALLSLGNPTAAANEFQAVVDLAPDSHYAQQARGRLLQLPPPTTARSQAISDPNVVQAGYEIKHFDRSPLVEALKDQPWTGDEPGRLSFQLESGVLFNTNLSLAPTSRELAPETPDSFQGFLNPALEYALLDTGEWRAGPVFTGYFTLNEGRFSDLNLESYQPGVFLERTFVSEGGIFVPRLQYDYTYDRFGRVTLAERHAITLSATAYHNEGSVSLLYWTLDYTDFADDGDTPDVTSRDGLTNTLGLGHSLRLEGFFKSIGAGIELQRADVEGDDFKYNGIALNLDAEIPLGCCFFLDLEAGWGYRDYPDFTLTPSRNEHIWHAGCRLRLQATDNWSVSAVFNYDRFDSENELFAADRYVGGLITTLAY
jgi:tetratricopeptide (TPR) repeat protein